MKFERERATHGPRDGNSWAEISPVSEAQLRRGLRYLHGISASRIAILTDDDGSFVQVGGSGMTCCLEWRDQKRGRHFRAFQNPPVVPWSGVSQLRVSSGSLTMQKEEYFRIHQVEEAFVAFLRHEPFPEYVQWRDITEEVAAQSRKSASSTQPLDPPASVDSAGHRIKPEPTRTVRNRISKQLTQLLADRKFRKKNDYLIAGPWGEAQAEVWSRLRKCKCSGKVLIAISVGLSFEEVEKLLGREGSIQVGIDHFRGTNRTTEWDTAQPETVPEIIDRIKTYAFPFFEAYSTLDKVFTKLESEDPKDQSLRYVLGGVRMRATIMTLKGQKQAALDLLDREIDSALKSHPDPYASLSTRQYLQHYRDKISAFAGP